MTFYEVKVGESLYYENEVVIKINSKQVINSKGERKDYQDNIIEIEFKDVPDGKLFYYSFQKWIKIDYDRALSIRRNKTTNFFKNEKVKVRKQWDL